jgi:hypothetical protein
MAVGAGRVFAINLIANSKPAENAFQKVGQAAGRLPTPMAVAAAAITGAFVAVGAIIGKVGRELLELGEAFNDSFRTIRVGTGATGELFADLQDSFREVAKSVPNDMGDVATAIAELNTRTGATGSELEALALEFLTVSRLLGGDVQSNIRSVTRLFGDFGVEADDQVDLMNLLFRASQMTGAAFDTLADQTVQYGASLRNFGFTLPEAIALLGSFEKNGTNLETVMAGLRTAQLNLAATGKPLSQALADVIVEIQSMDDASAQATRASEIFGSKAGPDLVDAIRSGRFGVNELVTAIVEGSDTIQAAADDTDGFREAWEAFKNYIKVTLEPLATEVFQNLKGLVEELRPAVDRVVEAFEKDGLEGALAQVADEWDRIYQNQLRPLWEDKFLPFLNDTVKPLVIEVGVAIGTDFATAIWNGLKEWFNKNWMRLFSGLMSRLTPSGIAIDLLEGYVFPRLPDFDYTGPIGRSSSRDDAATRNLLRLGDGGLVTSPVLAQVGEAGAEVVIPLDRFERQYGSGAGDVFVTVNGALDAEGTARTILRVLRDAERRSGDRLGV